MAKRLLIACIILFLLSFLLALRVPEPGLIVRYYDKPNWKGQPVLVQQENPINLNVYEEQRRQKQLPATNFSISWNGWVRIDEKSSFHIMTASDDGSSVLIDDKLIIDNGGFHGIQKIKQEIVLSRGMHKININYFNGPGAYAFHFEFARDVQKAPDKPLPADAFYPTYSKKLEIAIQSIVVGWILYLLVVVFVCVKRVFRTFPQLPLIILVIFVVSSNIAWLNPYPGFQERWETLLKLSEKIPFLWQYNPDARIELYSAAYFPSYYKKNPMRLNRPGYPLIVGGLGKIAAFIFQPFAPFVKLTPEENARIGYVILKLFLYSVAGMMMYQLLVPYCREFCAFYAVALLYFHYFSIRYISTFHTTELQFLSPIILLFLFHSLAKNYSVQRNVIFSIMVGFLMLAKQNYAMYLAILLYSLWYRKFKAVGISVIAHAIPLLVWLGFLRLYGLKYYNHEAAVYAQGVWIYQEFIYLDILSMFKRLLDSFFLYLKAIVWHYSFWAFAAAIGTGYLYHTRRRVEAWFILFVLSLGSTWVQCFAANRYRTYMTADFSIFIFAISSYLVCNMVKKKPLLYLILIGWLLINIIHFIHLPWIHPYHQ